MFGYRRWYFLEQISHLMQGRKNWDRIYSLLLGFKEKDYVDLLGSLSPLHNSFPCPNPNSDLTSVSYCQWFNMDCARGSNERESALEEFEDMFLLNKAVKIITKLKITKLMGLRGCRVGRMWMIYKVCNWGHESWCPIKFIIKKFLLSLKCISEVYSTWYDFVR